MKLNKKLIIIIFSILIISQSYILFGYYTNVNKYFEIGTVSDGQNGFSIQRSSTEFIVDGCGTGTMLDTLTGLCWQKNMSSSGSLNWAIINTYVEPIWNTTTKVYFYPSGGKASYPIFSYCEDLSLGGKTDWRVPSKPELYTLMTQVGADGSSCTNLTSIGFQSCQNNFYWVSDTYIPDPRSAWSVEFNGARDADLRKDTFSFPVLCVRTDY